MVVGGKAVEKQAKRYIICISDNPCERKLLTEQRVLKCVDRVTLNHRNAMLCI